MVNVTCDRLVDEATGLITAHLQWSYVHDNISYIQEAIKDYRIDFALIKSGIKESTGGVHVLNATILHQVCIH